MGVRRTSRLSGGDQRCTIFTSWFLLTRNQVVCAGREPPVAPSCWEVMTAVVSCSLATAWLATRLPLVSCSPGHSCPGTQGVKGHGHQGWVPAASGMVCSELSVPPEGSVSNCSCGRRAGAAVLSAVLILETLKFSGLLMCLLVAKHFSLVYQFPRGSLLLIVPAPISLPILINLCQVKPQITCQVNDWVSPAFPWAFNKKGYHLPWVDYQSGLDDCGCMLCFFLPPWIRKIWSDSCRSVHALH